MFFSNYHEWKPPLKPLIEMRVCHYQTRLRGFRQAQSTQVDFVMADRHFNAGCWQTSIATPGKEAVVPHSCAHVYIHFVWATWNRAPFMTPALEAPVYACIASKCQELKCELKAIGGTEDHIHALVRLHSTVSAAVLVKGMKGASSHLINHTLTQDRSFQWQGTYGAFSVSPSDLQRVHSYISRQKQHHASADTWPDWERCMEMEDGTPP